MNPPDALIDDLNLLDPPEPFRINWWLAAGAGVALILLFLIFHLLRRGKRNGGNGPGAQRRALRDALAALEKLRPLVEHGQSYVYSEQSSEIVRKYIEERFALNAPRQSTEEFLENARGSSKLEPSSRSALDAYLRLCDLLKFARTTADRRELEPLHQAALDFVRNTQPPAAQEGTEPHPQEETA